MEESHGRTPRPDDEDAYCELSFSPNVNLIATVRQFVADFYVKVLKNPNVTSRLVVATHELLENAVHYSSDGKSRIRVGVKREGELYAVQIDTHNRTNEKDRAALRALLDELVASDSDRSGTYRRLLARSAKRERGSGLGLGRIHAESEMNLTCTIEDGDVVHLVAAGTFSEDGAPRTAPKMGTDPKGDGSMTTAAALKNIETPDLSTESEVTPTGITVRMSGSAETGAMSEVEGFLKRLHDKVLTSKLGEVVIDLRALEFMNSSCFKAFVSWIDRLQDSPADTRYRVRFIYDERKHWQSRSLGALAGFAVDLIQLETS